MIEIPYLILSIFLSVGLTLVIIYVVLRKLLSSFNILDPLKVKAGTKSGEMRRYKAKQKILKSGKNKIINNLGKLIPGGAELVGIMRALGLENEEILELAMNPEFMRGSMRIMNLLGGGVTKIWESITKKGDKRTSSRGYDPI